MTKRTAWIAGTGMIALTAIILLAMGRIPICECGYVRLWGPASDVSGSSQQIADWYAPSHIIHGFIFYWILSLVLLSRSHRSRYPVDAIKVWQAG